MTFTNIKVSAKKIQVMFRKIGLQLPNNSSNLCGVGGGECVCAIRWLKSKYN